MYIPLVVSRPPRDGGRTAFAIFIQVNVGPRLIVAYLKKMKISFSYMDLNFLWMPCCMVLE